MKKKKRKKDRYWVDKDEDFPCIYRVQTHNPKALTFKQAKKQYVQYLDKTLQRLRVQIEELSELYDDAELLTPEDIE